MSGMGFWILREVRHPAKRFIDLRENNKNMKIKEYVHSLTVRIEFGILLSKPS